jgi:hypothetical protein
VLLPEASDHVGRPVIEDPAEVEASALDPAFLQGILDRHRAEAHSLLAAAAEAWITDGCPRFNDHETSCTAVLVGFLADVIRKGRASAFQIAVFPETGGWTEAHLDGRSDPDAVPRPDIALFLGLHHDVKMPVECKRLLRPNSTARDYVLKGLYRFLSGTYESSDGQATMICFAMDRDAPTACEDINKVIREQLSADQILKVAPALGSLQAIYRSQNSRSGDKLEAVHLLLDIQNRPPPRPRART